jgi:hypothetical protein
MINPLNAELNPICCLLALLGAHNFLHVSRIRVKKGKGKVVIKSRIAAMIYFTATELDNYRNYCC